MAKPIEKYAGSGMHFHVSLQDADGQQRLRRGARRRAGRRTCSMRSAAWRRPWPESMLVFAPHANSWRRFVSQSYAPVAPTWGVNNRSVALRVPAGDVEEPAHRASPVGRRRQSLSGRRDRAGRHRQGPRRKARSRPGDHRQRLRERAAAREPRCRPTGARPSRRPRPRPS